MGIREPRRLFQTEMFINKPTNRQTKENPPQPGEDADWWKGE